MDLTKHQRKGFTYEDRSRVARHGRTPLPSASKSKIHTSDHQRGSVLVAVLAITLLLSFIITRFIDEAIEDLEYRAIFNEPADVRSFSYSMLEVALASIQEVALIDDGKLFAPEQGWADPIEYAGITVPNGWQVDIQIQDESGKLPINTMSEEMLNRMLEESFDFDFGTARELSSMLLDWIDENDGRRLNGAESEDYLRRDPPYRAANAPLQSLEELRLIEIWEDEFFDEDGQPNELFAQLDSMVSVLHTGATNLNSSPQSVLELLALQDGYDEDHLFDGLDDLPYLQQVPDSANSENSGVEVSLLRVTVNLWRGQVPFSLSALVEPNFSTEEGDAGSSSASVPGSDSSDAPKTGATSEQDAITYPFTILQVSEYSQGRPSSPPARYSALDIEEESGSF
ncbi:type II secretion system protein GspK [Coraliomargarita sp. SDUM461003]|uniref:Type II secretion system protein GspK n=1 Tax=Thalassobacterium maritimum TaxID=3041265 RepID=A0ABU1AVW6_9BACT|nr:type II secretion system protein GspK [Coraliomargarita sp. SDUM461003]MDQ8207414.1 type II secretion system protein GspK [Coraliomargarita sp. SDUM461003]